MKKATTLLFGLSLLMHSFCLNAETISGVFVDSNGEALIGATVLVKGTSNGTVSDLDGNFKLEVETLPQTIVFSYIGYETQEIIVSDEKALKIEAKSSDYVITECIVIACPTMTQTTNVIRCYGSTVSVTETKCFAKAEEVLTEEPLEKSAIETNWMDDIQIFPNPAVHSVNIQSPENFERMEIVNANGQMLLVQEGLGEGKTSIDISHLTNGLYLLRCYSKDEFITLKLLKKG